MSFFYELNQRMAKLAEKQDASQLAESKQIEAVKQSPLTQALNEAKAQKVPGMQITHKDIEKRFSGSPMKMANAAHDAGFSSGRINQTLDNLKHGKNPNDIEETDYSAKAGRAGKDLGKPGKNFSKIAKGAAERYGSKAAGERVAGAVLNKLRHPAESSDMEESALQAAIGKKKYGDQGMKALQKAGREHASDKTMNTIRNRYDKYDESVTDEGNEFTGNLAKAKAQHKDEFEVDGKKYKVVEADPTGLGEEEMAMDEGFKEMHAWLASREKEKGTGKFDKKKTSTGTVYTRKPETFDDPETDPEATGGAPKRVGRPKGKDKGPERVTAKAWKHKDGRLGARPPGHVREEENNDNMTIKQACAFLERHGYTVTKTGVDEEKAAQGQKKFFGMAHAAKTVNKAVNNIVKGRKETVDEESTDKEDTRAEKAGRKVAKDIEHDEGHKGQDDDRAEKAGKKVVKDIEYDDKKDRKEKKTEGAKPDFLDVDKDGDKKEPFKKAVADKKDEKVDETTTSGSVATAPAAAKSTKGMQFGKGVYESINTRVEGMITESMNITVNMSTDKHGEPHKSVTVTADGDDADKLAELLKMAGLGSHSSQATPCAQCGQTPCGCAEVVDENSPDWPTDTETLAAQPELRTYSGGLNGPKSTGQTTIPVIAGQLRRQTSMEENVELERSLFKTWKNYKG